MGKKKKVGSTGRLGPKYGRKIRVRLKNIEQKHKVLYICPSCKKKALKRLSAGIWECKKCKTKIAGGAYSPQTRLTEVE
jgi:large subunit ribosomal protein L37Ae